MAARKSGLGRGLGALLPVDEPTGGFAEVPLDDIVTNPQQPRERFEDDALETLAASIREVGVLQPVVVRPKDDSGSFMLVAGERRWRAARLAGLSSIPVVIRAGDEVAALAEALIENVQREDLTPLEEAAAYRQLMEDFGLTHEQVGERVGKSRSSVTNAIRLLSLPAPIQSLLENGDLSAGHARALLALDDVKYAEHIAGRAVAEGWSVRQVEDAVKARAGNGKAKTPVKQKTIRPAEILALEERLSARLGGAVRIDYGARGGKLTVRFGTVDDLERVYKTLLGE